MPVTMPARGHNVTLAGNTAGVLAEVSTGTLTIAGGNNVTLSQAGNAVTISARHQLSAGMSTNGNTSGDTGIVDRRLVLAGGNNITLSGSTAAGGSMTITISGPNVGGAQTGISGLANSETTYTSGSVTFSALGAITIRSTTGQHFQFSVNAQTVQPEGTQTIGMSSIGNTAGDTTPVTGTGIQVVLAGGNNITLSQSTNGSSASITISAFNQSVQPEGTQTIGMSNIGNTAGDTTPVTGTGIRVVFAGGNNITLSQSTNGSSATITISAFNQTSPVVGADIASVSSATNSGTATSQFAAEDHVHAGVGPAGVSNVGNTSGDTGVLYGRVVLAGGNNVTLSVSSSNNNAQTITISAGAGGGAAGTNTIGMSNIGNTSGDTTPVTGTGIRVIFAGGNNVTLSQSTNGSSATVTISAFTQSAEQNTIGMSNIGNTSGDTAIRSGPQIQVVFAGGNNITLSQSTNGSSATVTISAFNQTSPVVGADIASVSSATNSGTATSQFAAEDHVHAGVGPLGVSNIGNTSGDTGTQYGRVVLAGGNNVTLSVSSSNNGAQTITISGAAGGAGEAFSGGISNLGNTAGSTGVVSKRLVLVGSDGIGLSGSTDAGSATVSIIQSSTLKSWGVPHTPEVRSPGTLAADGNFMLQPWHCPGYLTAHSLLMMVSGSGASGSTASVTIPVGVYTQQTGVSSSRLSLMASAQFTTSWTSGTNADNNWGGVFGMRRWALGIDVSFTPGYYWIGVGLRTTNAGTFSFAGNASNQALSGVLGASNTTRQLAPFMGGYSASTLTAPNSILSNEVLGAGGNRRVQPWVGFVNTNEFNLGA